MLYMSPPQASGSPWPLPRDLFMGEANPSCTLEEKSPRLTSASSDVIFLASVGITAGPSSLQNHTSASSDAIPLVRSQAGD